MTDLGTAPVPATDVDRRALRAVAAQFFVNGALFASFIPRLPEIRDRVDISTAAIGVLMSLAGATGLISSAFVGRAIERFGTRRVMLVAGTIIAAALALIGVATTAAVLAIGLIGMLAFDVPVDVAMNMQGSWLSDRRPVPVMNRLHGLWSLGTVVGGVSSSRIADQGVSLNTHLIASSAVLLLVVVLVNRDLLRVDEVAPLADQVDPSAPTGVRSSMVLLAMIGFFAVAVEGASIDWAAFRLVDDFGASAGRGALAYVAVTAGMTVGRFGGDWATKLLGPFRLAAVASLTTGIGLAAASLAANELAVLLGYTLAGLGIAPMLPTIYDRAAKQPGRPGAGLGALTGGIRLATLLVPATVGLLATTNLSTGSALAVVTLPSVVAFAGLVLVVIRRTEPASPDG